MLNAAITSRVEAKVAECIATIERKYNVTFRKPVISYNVRGTTAGKAFYTRWIVDFNPVLLAENVEEFLIDTVPHEVAHLATELIYPHAHRGGFGTKRRPHGSEWKSIMRSLGADPERCHTYDVANAKVRNVANHEYKCQCCGKQFMLGPKRHAKIKAGANYFHPQCGKVQGKLVPVAQATNVVVPVKLPAPTKVANESKFTKCYRLFENYPGYSRAEMINVFVQEADMTPAGAATYYAKCKQLRG